MWDGAEKKIFQWRGPVFIKVIIAAEHQHMLQGSKAGLDAPNKGGSFGVGDENAGPRFGPSSY
jgi:hypothetical protein